MREGSEALLDRQLRDDGLGQRDVGGVEDHALRLHHLGRLHGNFDHLVRDHLRPYSRPSVPSEL